MALSGLDIYKLLPKTNCRDCGFPTCLAFAMALAKKSVALQKCPHLSAQAQETLEASSQPPIRLVSVGDRFRAGNETVLFRHEEKFHNPCGIGFVIDDTDPAARVQEALAAVSSFVFERVGQTLSADLIALRQRSSAAAFVQLVEAAAKKSALGLVLMSSDVAAVRASLSALKGRKPLLFPGEDADRAAFCALAKEFSVPLVVSAGDLAKLEERSIEAAKAGVGDLMLYPGRKDPAQTLWDLTQIRRQALKKSNRALGYPVIAVVEADDPFAEVAEAAAYIAKYAGMVLVRGTQPWQALSLLTVRQNIYTDPQKPLQIEAKLYPVGAVSASSPLLITTNFSLSYYTVLGEVEASKVPSYILSVDTEGMSVLTAWAAEKFNAETITASLKAQNAEAAVSRRRVVIPGYVAVMSGDLQEQSGWEVLVGPKEAAGLPAFLKNLS